MTTTSSHAITAESPGGPRLLVVRASARSEVGQVLSLTGAPAVLGREVGCDLRFDDPGVSRRHATVERTKDGAVCISDCESTNGLFVNGRRVNHARLLEGDEVRLGPAAVMRFVRDRAGEALALGQGLTVAQVAFWTCSVPEFELTWSDAIDRMLGVPEGTLSGTPLDLTAIIAPEDCARLRSALELASHGTPLNVDVGMRVKNRHFELRGELIPSMAGVSAYVAGSAWDVTARRLASLQLRHHAALFESFTEPVAFLDLEGKVLDCNTATLRLFGAEKETLVGRTLDSPNHPEWTATALERVRRLGRYEGDWTQRRPSGEEVVCEVVVTPLLDGNEVPLGYVAVHRDVTETRQLQARLALTDRLAAMGTLSAGIAHEINNPLAYLRANLDHILSTVADGAPTRGEPLDDLLESIRDSAEGVERIARIVRDLKFFSRAGHAESQPTDVAAALRLACKMATPMLRNRADLTVDAPPVKLARADEARLAQVVLNLLINAAQAMPEGRATDNRIGLKVRDEAGGVLLEVSDNGTGMPPEILRRVFDPFFTTKPTGVGSGLGLSICHGIIESLGGTISAQSTLGVGTTFRVWLMHADEQRALGHVPPAEVSATPPLRVLLVDDEARVVKALTRTLGAHHQVSSAHDATEALRVLHAGADFDLVLCDVIMPGLTGVELHRRVAAEAPELASRFVFMTGGGLSPTLQAGLDRTGLTVLEKPLDHARLFQVLEARAATCHPAKKPGDETLRRLRAVS